MAEQAADIARPTQLRAVMTPVAVADGDEGGVAGDCPAEIVTHTNANFGGGQFVAQGGFAEMEVAAASYTIPAADFPLRIDLIEMIFATSAATMTTTTHWSILVWEGTPNTGNLVAEFMSDDVILPHIVLGPGTQGVNVQVMVDPMDPEQIIVQDIGNQTFSVGYRIDMHHQQTQDPCLTAPPSCCNAFPTTDVGGLASLSGNWLFAVSGPFCLCDGWNSFATLPGFCRPSGDWVIRATYTPVFCSDVMGACCLDNGSCVDPVTQMACVQTLSGNFQGQGSVCVPGGCPQLGACCLANGSCMDALDANCSGDFQGEGTNCGTTNCPEPPQACCFMGPPSSCSNLSPTDCGGFGGLAQGSGTNCTSTVCFPRGACCNPIGSCTNDVALADCVAGGGTFQGNNTLCSGVVCPQPTGACCSNATTFCSVLTQANCGGIPNTSWAGALTNCSGDVDGDGEPDACDTPAGCSCSTAVDCRTPGCADDNACNCVMCVSGTCVFSCAKFGNVTCDGTQIVNIDDILCVLGGFGLYANCPNGDINPCGGNGIINLDDILSELTAFAGMNQCGCMQTGVAPVCGSISP